MRLKSRFIPFDKVIYVHNYSWYHRILVIVLTSRSHKIPSHSTCDRCLNQVLKTEITITHEKPCLNQVLKTDITITHEKLCHKFRSVNSPVIASLIW